MILAGLLILDCETVFNITTPPSINSHIIYILVSPVFVQSVLFVLTRKDHV